MCCVAGTAAALSTILYAVDAVTVAATHLSSVLRTLEDGLPTAFHHATMIVAADLLEGGVRSRRTVVPAGAWRCVGQRNVSIGGGTSA